MATRIRYKMCADGKSDYMSEDIKPLDKGSRLLWQWIFTGGEPLAELPAFNPPIADKVFKSHGTTVLLLTAIRSRALWLRKVGKLKASANHAVAEFYQTIYA